MLKRCLLVLVLVAGGAALGVLATGALRLRDGVASAEAAKAAAPAPASVEPAAPVTAGHPVPVSYTPPAAPAPAPQQPGTNANGPRIAVVNLKVIMDEQSYEGAKKVGNEIRKLRSEIDTHLKNLVKEGQDLRTQAEGLQPQSALWNEKVRKIRLLETQHKVDKEMGQVRLSSEVQRITLEMYNEIRRVIELYARDKKYDFVLRVEEPQLDEEQQRDVWLQISQRVVLYHGESVDVTKDVLDLLNKEYKQREANRAPAPPAPAEARVCPNPECKGLTTLLDKCPKCGKEIPKK